MQKDKLTIKAKSEGYKARSVYKLLDINKKYKLIKKSDFVLDLGCWPGSWLQACMEMQAGVIGVDLRDTKINGAETYKMDVMDKGFIGLLKGKIKDKRFDAVLSDLAPNTTGHIEADQYRSYELSERAFEAAKAVLKPGGNFLAKIFQGKEADDFLAELRKWFKFVKAVKPEGSKKRSREIYYVCTGYKG